MHPPNPPSGGWGMLVYPWRYTIIVYTDPKNIPLHTTYIYSRCAVNHEISKTLLSNVRRYAGWRTCNLGQQINLVVGSNGYPGSLIWDELFMLKYPPKNIILLIQNTNPFYSRGTMPATL